MVTICSKYKERNGTARWCLGCLICPAWIMIDRKFLNSKYTLPSTCLNTQSLTAKRWPYCNDCYMNLRRQETLCTLLEWSILLMASVGGCYFSIFVWTENLWGRHWAGADYLLIISIQTHKHFDTVINTDIWYKHK